MFSEFDTNTFLKPHPMSVKRQPELMQGLGKFITILKDHHKHQKELKEDITQEINRLVTQLERVEEVLKK